MPAEHVFEWIAQNLPEEAPSLTRAISQRFTTASARAGLGRRPGSPSSSPSSSPRSNVMDGSPNGPNGMLKDKGPAPPPPPPAASSSNPLSAVASEQSLSPRSTKRVSIQTDPVAAPTIERASVVALALEESKRLHAANAPGARDGSRLRNQVTELEATLRDVRTALETLHTNADRYNAEEMRGALKNVLRLAAPSSPRTAAAGGLPPNMQLSSSASPRASNGTAAVPATSLQHSRSGKHLEKRESGSLLSLINELPPSSVNTPTYKKLVLLLEETAAAAAATRAEQSHAARAEPTPQRLSSVAIPSAPTTALQLHKGNHEQLIDVYPRAAITPRSQAAASATPRSQSATAPATPRSVPASAPRDVMLQLLLEIKQEADQLQNKAKSNY